MGEGPFAVVCAWCNRIVNPPARRKPVTHTICASCLERAVAQQGGGVSKTEDLSPPPEYFGNILRH